MPNHPECLGAAIRCSRPRCGQRGRFGAQAIVSLVAVLALSCGVFAQNMAMSESVPNGIDPSAPPMVESGNVNFFSQDLGTVLRLRYNTESYGQNNQGNVDIGTMQVITMDDRAALFDGQVTLNDANGVGFNLGVGYRWMNFPSYAMESGRLDGVAIWADGTHTEAGNFFPQIGLSYESLGEIWDVRSNLYVPVGKQDQVGNFKQTGETGFIGNSIAQLTRAVVDSSYTVGEVEFARRLGSERDAWGFAGPYFVTNDNDNSAGGRAGVRGYAVPDLLLQFAISQDDVFHTNATFSLQWFIGRTRTNFQPCGGVPDRMREPFMRNDYVALSKSFKTGGDALTNPDGSALRIVHIDSNAAAGGNGTFENPYNELDEANGGGSQTGDILFAHSTSTFDTNSILQNNQRLLGEGDGLEHTVTTLQEGTIVIPESSPGARSLARPIIATALGDAITLAGANEVSNFDIDGQGTLARAIAAPVGGAGNPNLNHLAISDTTGNGIELTPDTITDPNDATRQIVRGNVTINTVTLTDIGGNGIDIDSATTTDVTLPTVTLQETIAMSNVTSTNGAGRGINLENTHTGRTATLSNYTYDGGTTSFGALRLNNIDGTFTASASTLTNGSSAVGSAGVQVLGDTDGTLNFQSTFVLNNVDSATAFDINGFDGATDVLGGSITMAGTITNETGRSVSVQNLATGANVAFNGNITDTGLGLLVNSNSGGDVTFLGDLALTIDTALATAIQVTDNNAAVNTDFAGDVVINATSTANGFVATDAGTISAPGTVNSVSTETGRAVHIQNTNIAAAGVRFGDVNRTGAGADSAIELVNNTSAGTGAIVIGNTTDTIGDAGTIEGGTDHAIDIVNSANVSITGLIVNNGANAFSGVRVQKSNTAAMTTNISDIEVRGGLVGIETIGGGTGALTMTVNDTNINGNATTQQGMLFNNLDTGTVQANNVIIDGGNAAVDGVQIVDSNASITFDAASRIRKNDGDDFEVSGGTGTISFAGGIENSNAVNNGDNLGRSVNIHGVTGGSVTLTSAATVVDANQGMLITGNTGGTVNIQSENTLNTGIADAVTVTNNTGATVNLSELTITTTSGDGLVATGGGTLNVLGLTNTITTTTGTGLDIENMTIGGSGVSFQSVSVNGATNGIVLRNTTGTGDIAIGNTGGAQNSGGTLTNTTGDAIVLENTSTAILRHIQITGAGGEGIDIDHTGGATNTMTVSIQDLNLDSSAGAGIDVLGANNSQAFNLLMTNSDLEERVNMSITGSGAFGLLVDNNDISTTGTDVAFALSFSGSAQNGDVTIRNGNTFAADNASALSITTAGATFKTIDLLVADSLFSNNSLDAATNFQSSGNTLMNATIQGNVFDDANAGGEDFVMASNGAQGRIRLNLGGDAAADFNTAAGTTEFQLFENGGSDFDVFEKTDTFAGARNTGTVVPNPNAAAFDDAAVAPPLPVVPTEP